MYVFRIVFLQQADPLIDEALAQLVYYHFRVRLVTVPQHTSRAKMHAE